MLTASSPGVTGTPPPPQANRWPDAQGTPPPQQPQFFNPNTLGRSPAASPGPSQLQVTSTFVTFYYFFLFMGCIKISIKLIPASSSITISNKHDICIP
jgi:hypothetical protein